MHKLFIRHSFLHVLFLCPPTYVWEFKEDEKPAIILLWPKQSTVNKCANTPFVHAHNIPGF